MAIAWSVLLDNAERASSPWPRSASPAVPLVGLSPRGDLASRAIRRARRWSAVLVGRPAPADQDRHSIAQHAAYLAALGTVTQRPAG